MDSILPSLCQPFISCHKMQERNFNSSDKILKSHLLHISLSAVPRNSKALFSMHFHYLEKMCPLGRNSKTIVQVLNQISQVCKRLCCEVAKQSWLGVLNDTLMPC